MLSEEMNGGEEGPSLPAVLPCPQSGTLSLFPAGLSVTEDLDCAHDFRAVMGQGLLLLLGPSCTLFSRQGLQRLAHLPKLGLQSPESS